MPPNRWVVKCIDEYDKLEGVDHAFALSPTTLIKLGVIDGGANVMKSFKLLGLAILYCMAHKLHLCVKRSMNQPVWKARSEQGQP